ncbi:hypothetical protein J5N97_017448 [Dioscorea zingiberensis]|uniref:Retrotransposon gag domain-containing protein n=1 Tax=Dioscorea zingiberensis TaxID=325984 RepID=A0A9D5HGJ6_9LILI|nr:hypothetical protein J5N97_017448 [Dioscorea zingiberensis]
MQQFFEQMAQSFATFPNFQQQQQQHQQQQQPRGQDYVTRARQMGLNHFLGTQDSTEADAWIRQLEMVFEAMRIPEDEKVITVQLLLGQDALMWWESAQMCLPRSGVWTWTEFKKAFEEEYSPRIHRDAKRAEFIYLTQGNSTVAEYWAKFTALSRYAPEMVEDPYNRCRRFEDGLRDEIKIPVMAHGFEDFRGVVESALRVERGLNKQKQRLDKWNKRSSPSSQGGGDTRPTKKSNSSSSGGSSTSGNNKGKPQYTVCGKFHYGTCGGDACSYCKQPGYYKKQCSLLTQGSGVAPQATVGDHNMQQTQGFSVLGGAGGSRGGSTGGLSRGGGRGAPSQLQAQAFAMTQEQAVNTPDVIAGTVQIFNTDACVLIDPGSTHSYIAVTFLVPENVYATRLTEPMSVAPPIGSSMIVKLVYEGCDVKIGEQELIADLIPMSLGWIG